MPYGNLRKDLPAALLRLSHHLLRMEQYMAWINKHGTCTCTRMSFGKKGDAITFARVHMYLRTGYSKTPVYRGVFEPVDYQGHSKITQMSDGRLR